MLSALDTSSQALPSLDDVFEEALSYHPPVFPIDSSARDDDLFAIEVVSGWATLGDASIQLAPSGPPSPSDDDHVDELCDASLPGSPIVRHDQRQPLALPDQAVQIASIISAVSVIDTPVAAEELAQVTDVAPNHESITPPVLDSAPEEPSASHAPKAFRPFLPWQPSAKSLVLPSGLTDELSICETQGGSTPMVSGKRRRETSPDKIISSKASSRSSCDEPSGKKAKVAVFEFAHELSSVDFDGEDVNRNASPHASRSNLPVDWLPCASRLPALCTYCGRTLSRRYDIQRHHKTCMPRAQSNGEDGPMALADEPPAPVYYPPQSLWVSSIPNKENDYQTGTTYTLDQQRALLCACDPKLPPYAIDAEIGKALCWLANARIRMSKGGSKALSAGHDLSPTVRYATQHLAPMSAPSALLGSHSYLQNPATFSPVDSSTHAKVVHNAQSRIASSSNIITDFTFAQPLQAPVPHPPATSLQNGSGPNVPTLFQPLSSPGPGQYVPCAPFSEISRLSTGYGASLPQFPVSANGGTQSQLSADARAASGCVPSNFLATGVATVPAQPTGSGYTDFSPYPAYPPIIHQSQGQTGHLLTAPGYVPGAQPSWYQPPAMQYPGYAAPSSFPYPPTFSAGTPAHEVGVGSLCYPGIAGSSSAASASFNHGASHHTALGYSASAPGARPMIQAPTASLQQGL